MLEPVAPPEFSINRWVPNSAPAPGAPGRRGQQLDETSPEVVDRKVKSLLSKLSMERFDSNVPNTTSWLANAPWGSFIGYTRVLQRKLMAAPRYEVLLGIVSRPTRKLDNPHKIFMTWR
jgi:hypothetical protein